MDSDATSATTPTPAPPVLGAVPGADYAALGALIQAELPYGTQIRLPRLEGDDVFGQDDANALVKIGAMRYPDNHVVRRQGLHEANTAAGPIKFKPNKEFTPAEREQLIPVNIPDKDGTNVLYEFTKVLRVWYTFKTKKPVIDEATGLTTGEFTNEDMDVGTFLIVGYVGNGQP